MNYKCKFESASVNGELVKGEGEIIAFLPFGTCGASAVIRHQKLDKKWILVICPVNKIELI